MRVITASQTEKLNVQAKRRTVLQGATDAINEELQQDLTAFLYQMLECSGRTGLTIEEIHNRLKSDCPAVTENDANQSIERLKSQHRLTFYYDAPAGRRYRLPGVGDSSV
jgi:hypothetical protein